MMYFGYQMLANASDPLREFAQSAMQTVNQWRESTDTAVLRKTAAYYEQIAIRGFTNTRPEFNIQPVKDNHGNMVDVLTSVTASTPFCNLVRFRKDTQNELPRVLLVAPMSGHFATLLRGTVQTLVQDHEVYLTDWLNIRDIALTEGRFGLDEYVDEIIHFLRVLGAPTHLMAVCQPTVACIVAASVLAMQRDPAVPASLILMAGPIDTRMNPTKVNELSMTKPISWFESNLISSVPLQFKGYGRRVYPGFVQLTAFMNMNMARHKKSFQDLFDLRVAGDHDKANQIRDFYQEYFAIMDLSADFYLETVEKVFQLHLLPKGELTYKGERVRPDAIRRTFLLTVEGMRDDICGIGQTLAAQDLCSRIPPYMKSHHLQAGVGHYGVFSGKRWNSQIYPVVRGMIQAVA
jgi:poly(3-hydroxybutyrate) depolymerase